MARGDVFFFNESLAFLIEGGWEPTDVVKVAICDNTVTPTVATATPSLGDFTQVGTAGSYISGGTSIGDIGTLVTQSGGIVTIDSATNPTWAQNVLNDTDAFWGLMYNDTDAGDAAIGYVDLGGPVDMTAGPLTITWNPIGIATLTTA